MHLFHASTDPFTFVKREIIVVDSEGSGSGTETATTVTLCLGPISTNNSSNNNNNNISSSSSSNNNNNSSSSRMKPGKPSGAFLAELNGSVASR